MLINMNKNVNENHEYKMKQQWKTLSLMCVVLMAFLTIFLMRAYRRNTENEVPKHEADFKNSCPSACRSIYVCYGQL